MIVTGDKTTCFDAIRKNFYCIVGKTGSDKFFIENAGSENEIKGLV